MSAPAGRMATLAEFARGASECESTADSHQGDLDRVSDDVAGEYVLCARHARSFRRVRDGYDGLTEGDR